MTAKTGPVNSLVSTSECDHCEVPLAEIVTSKISKGQPRTVLVDPVPDVAGTYTCTLTSQGKYSGNECSKGQLAGAKAHGVPLYTDHTKTCAKRGTSHRSTR
jgi:hypothetical protein